MTFAGSPDGAAHGGADHDGAAHDGAAHDGAAHGGADRRGRRRFLTGAAAAGMMLAAGGCGLARRDDVAGPAPVPPDSGVSSSPLGRGAVTRGALLDVRQATDVVVNSVVIAPGGSNGWHTHPGPELIVVRKGQLTFRRVEGSTCVTETVGPGQAFVGAAQGEVHAAHNAGSEPVEFVVLFLNVATGASTRSEADPPAACDDAGAPG